MKKGFVLIHLVLLTLLSFLGARTFYAQLGGSVPPVTLPMRIDVSPGDTGERTNEKHPPRQHYAIIEKRNLFKVALEEEKVPLPAGSEMPMVENLEKTSLDLKLLGTIIMKPQGAFAIIQEGRKKEQKRYQQGDVVQEAQIKAVLRGKVILHYKGRDEVLVMGAAQGGAAPSDASSLFSEMAPPVEPGEKTSLSRSLVDEALGNINKLMEDVRVRPHFSRGQPDGLLLYGIKKDSIFQTMGFKNGDIIMGVDGREIQSVDDALTFYEQLKESSDVNVQIKRRGQTKEIQYHVE